MTREQIFEVSPVAERQLPRYFVVPGFVKNSLEPTTKHELVREIVLEHFQATMKEMCTKRRKRELVYRRQVLHYMMKIHTRLSLKSIGEITGRDHTTVIHSVNTIKDLMDTDNIIRNEVNMLSGKISNAVFYGTKMKTLRA